MHECALNLNPARLPTLARYQNAFRRKRPRGEAEEEEEDAAPEAEGDDVISEDDDVAVMVIDRRTGRRTVEVAHVEAILVPEGRGRRRRKGAGGAKRAGKGLEHSGWASVNDPDARLVLRFWEPVEGKFESAPKRPHMTLPRQAGYKIQQWSMEHIVWVVAMIDVEDADGQVLQTEDGHKIAAMLTEDFRMCALEEKGKRRR